MAARGFNANENYETPAGPETPTKLTYHCRAHNCPMPASTHGHCVHHWRANTHDWGRITGTIYSLKPLVDEILYARTLLSNPEGNPDAQVKGHIAAAARLEPYLSDEQKEYLAKRPAKTYNALSFNLEILLQAAIQRVLKHTKDERNTEHPDYANRVRAAQIPGQAADFLAGEGLGL